MKKLLQHQCCQKASSIMKILSVQTFIAILVASISYAHDLSGQGIMDKEISVQFEEMSLKKALSKIERIADVKFTYSPSIIEADQKVSVRASKQKLAVLLDELLTPINISYRVIAERISLYKAQGNELHSVNDRMNTATLILTVTGKVTDDTEQPLPGVNVLEKGTTNGTTTDSEGNFSLGVQDENSVLVFSFIGYKEQEIAVGSRTEFSISLEPEVTSLEEIVVVGYGTQKKATLTGSVSAVTNEDIVTTKNENVQNMLTGKIAGVRVTQKTAEPGSFNNNFDIRAMGSPLIIIDGIPRSADVLQRMDPNDIDNISVLKDASAAIYGVRAANGVVLVTTKRGTSNKIELNYSGAFTWQIPSGLPPTVDAIEYMTLRNERAMHNVNGGSPIFNEDQFEEYKSGEKTSTDWYPLVFSKYAPQTVHNLNVTGGNDRTTYYAGMGYQYQEGFFRSGDLSYTKYNIRSNITTRVSDRLTFDINLNMIMDEQERPYQDSWWIIRGFWRQGAHIPAYANNDPTKPYHGLIEGDNPISFMNKDIVGYKRYGKKWFQPAASLKYDIPGVEGLTLKGLLSYEYYVSSSTLFRQAYDQYRYDDASGTYTTFTRQSPNRIRRESYFKDQILTQASLNYEGTFNKHRVGALALWEAQKRTSDNFFAQRDLILPLPYIFAGIAENQQATMNSGADGLYENANLALAGRVNYAFSDKYLAEFLFRYDGSSKFAPDYQWGFFPAASVGWRISEEPFFKDASGLSFLSQLKFRASYGKTGDDGASSYQFISGYNYPTSTSSRNFTGGYVFDGSFYASANSKGVPNPYITWFTSKTFDVGVDFELWNGLLGVTADYFSRHRDGLLDERSGGIPTVVGADLPEENLNSDRTYGVDLELRHAHRIGSFRYNATGLFSLARVKRLYDERGAIGSSWSNWVNNQNNRLQGVHRGLQGIGQYESWEQIWASPTYIPRGTLIGDYIYEDWNGDGEINGNDVHPIRFNQYPWMNFSLIFNAAYRNFDLNFLLQGSAMSSLVYGEQLREPMWGSGNSGAMEQFMDRWHPVDPFVDPYDPATEWVEGHFAYTGTLPDVNSSFNVENSAYLRLKSIELGYTLPDVGIEKIGIKNLRVYVNTYNLFTITEVKYVDPEHPDDTYGYLYPLNKTVSAGLNLTF